MKKMIAFLLAAVLFFGALLPAHAAPEPEAAVNGVPRVVVAVPKQMRVGETAVGQVVVSCADGIALANIVPDQFVVYGLGVEISDVMPNPIVLNTDDRVQSYVFSLTARAAGKPQIGVKAHTVLGRGGTWNPASVPQFVTVYPSYPDWFSEGMAQFCDRLFEFFFLIRPDSL